MTSAIERAVALAERIPPAEIKRSSRQLVLVSTQVERGSALLDNLLGIEEASKPRVENGLAVLKREQVELQNRVTFGTKYHLLSMEPLTWRDKNGWPRLIVFSLDSPHFEISVSARSTDDWRNLRFSTKMFPTLPDQIVACYSDVQKILRKKAGARHKAKTLSTYDTGNVKVAVKLSCRFEGIIPDDVKGKIAEARGSFKEIFLVAEPTGFEINITAIVVPKRDPLVVGFDGKQLWLIADFETTPIEEAMIFTLSSEKKGE